MLNTSYMACLCFDISEPNTWYEVSLQGFNMLGDGEPTIKSVQTLAAGTPGEEAWPLNM